MKTVTIRLDSLEKVKIPLGFVGENLHRRIIFVCDDAFKEYPNATATITVESPAGVKYPGILVKYGNNVYWDIRDSDVAVDGNGQIQLTFTEGVHVKKEYKTRTFIEKSIVANSPSPDPVEDWVEQANETLEDLAAMDNIAKNAQESDIGKSLSPKTVVDGVVTEWQYTEPSGGTDDYTDLNNKPQIAGVTLSGNKSLTDLGIASTESLGELSGEVTNVKNEIRGVTPDAQQSDIGKALILKTIDQTGKPTAFEYGEAGGGSVDPSVVEQKVNAWMSENITNPDSPPLDRSLSSGSAAAPADIVGEVMDIVQDVETTPIEVLVDRTYNGYGVSVGDTFDPYEPGTNVGSACVKVVVTEGERYRINADGNGGAFKCVIIVNTSWKVTRIFGETYVGDVVIEEGEYRLFYTCWHYNSSTNGIWKVKIENIDETVEQLKNGTLDYGAEKPTTEPIKVNYGYNTAGENIGDKYTSTGNEYTGNSCQWINVEKDTTYLIYGIGNQYSYCLYTVLDKDDYIIDIYKNSTNHRVSPKIVTPASNACKIIINYWGYDSTKDHTTKIKSETIGRLFDEVDSPLKGKTVLLLGDSILGNERPFDVGTYLMQYTGATVINGAIGGTRLCGDTRGTSDYTPFDGENLVEAITTGVWTEQDAHASGVVSYVSTTVLPALKIMDLDDVDIVVFNWMSNDYTSNTTKAKFKTAFENVVNMLLTTNPRLRLLAVTMIWSSYGGNSDTTQDYTIGTGYDAADCTKEIADKMHIPVLDMYRISPFSNLTKTAYYQSDYIHPNSSGKKIYAGIIKSKLMELMK